MSVTDSVRTLPPSFYVLLPLETLNSFSEHRIVRGTLLHARSVDYCKGSEAKKAVQSKMEGAVLCSREGQCAAPPPIQGRTCALGISKKL